MDDKYSKFIKAIRNRMDENLLLLFDESIAKVMIENKNKNSLEWNKLIDVAKYYPQMRSFLLARRELPVFYENEVIDMADTKLLRNYMETDTVTEDGICKIIQRYIDENKLYLLRVGATSNQAINSMCKNLSEKQLRRIGYKPFEYTKEINTKEMMDRVRFLLKNGATERLVCNVINNKNIVYGKRNEFFDYEIMLDGIHEFTPHITQELFDLCMENIYGESSELNTVEDKRAATVKIAELSITGHLTKSMEMEYMKKNQENYNVIETAYKSILQNTKHKDVLKKVLEFETIGDVEFRSIEENKHIDDDIFYKLIERYSDNEMIREEYEMELFYQKFYEMNLSFKTYQKMINKKDVYLDYILLHNPKTTHKVDEEIRSSWLGNENYSDFCYLKCVKDTMNTRVINEVVTCAILSDVIMDFFHRDFEKDNDSFLSSDEMFHTISKSCKCDIRLLMLDDEKYKQIMLGFKEIDSLYPDYKNTTLVLRDKVNEVYEFCTIFNKHEDLFWLEYTEKDSYQYKFQYEIWENYTQEQKQRFLDSLREEENSNVLYYIENLIMYYVIDEIPKHKMHEIHMAIYHLADLYEKIKIREKEIREKELVISKDDVEELER